MRYATALLALTLVTGCYAPVPPGEESAPGSSARDASSADSVVDAAAEDASVATGFAETRGARIFYEEAGTGRPVVLAHGGMLDRRMWDDQFQVLARQFRVIRFDARGHGGSSFDSSPYRPHEDLVALLDQLGIDAAILVGHSMGARVAIDFVLAHPDRVLALVAVSPGLNGYTRAEVRPNENQLLWARAMRDKKYDLAVEYFLRLYTDGPQRSPSEIDPNTRTKVRDMALAVFRSERHPGPMQSVEPPAVGRLSEISVPTLVIHGDLDAPGTLEIGEMLEKQIAGARRVVIPGTAHMVNMERPEELNTELLAFLEQTFP